MYVMFGRNLKIPYKAISKKKKCKISNVSKNLCLNNCYFSFPLLTFFLHFMSGGTNYTMKLHCCYWI